MINKISRAIFAAMLLCMLTVGVAWNIDEGRMFVKQSFIPHENDSIVMIMSGTGHGTGFYIDDNLIVTNSHVVHGKQMVKVQNNDGNVFIGRVVLDMPEKDLALIEVPRIHSGPPVILDTSGVDQGDIIYTVGNGGDTWQSPVYGKVSYNYYINSARMGIHCDMIKVKSAIIPGHSGSPTFLENGNVIGVVSLGNGTHAYLIPAIEVVGLWETYKYFSARVPSFEYNNRR